MAAIAPAAIGAGASLVGSFLGGGSSKTEKQALQAQQQQMFAQRALSQDMQRQASPLVQMAGRSFNPVMNYWGNLLSGDRGAMTQTLAPQLNIMGDQYRAATQAASELMPRGGGRATMMQQLPFQQMRDVQQLYQQAQPMAAQGMAQIGGMAGQMGSNLLSNASAALSGSTAAGRSILDYSMMNRAQNRNFGEGLGSSIYSVLKGLPKFGGAGGGDGGITVRPVYSDEQ